MIFLNENGFYYAGGCNCGGTRTETYKCNKFPQMIIKIRPNRATFEIQLFDHQWATGHIGNMETKFKEALMHLEKPFV